MSVGGTGGSYVPPSPLNDPTQNLPPDTAKKDHISGTPSKEQSPLSGRLEETEYDDQDNTVREAANLATEALKPPPRPEVLHNKVTKEKSTAVEAEDKPLPPPKPLTKPTAEARAAAAKAQEAAANEAQEPVPTTSSTTDEAEIAQEPATVAAAADEAEQPATEAATAAEKAERPPTPAAPTPTRFVETPAASTAKVERDTFALVKAKTGGAFKGIFRSKESKEADKTALKQKISDPTSTLTKSDIMHASKTDLQSRLVGIQTRLTELDSTIKSGTSRQVFIAQIQQEIEPPKTFKFKTEAEYNYFLKHKSELDELCSKLLGLMSERQTSDALTSSPEKFEEYAENVLSALSEYNKLENDVKILDEKRETQRNNLIGGLLERLSQAREYINLEAERKKLRGF